MGTSIIRRILSEHIRPSRDKSQPPGTGRKVASNAMWLAFDKVIRIGGGFLIGVWVARYLGPEKFGILNYSIAWVGLFGVFTALGMDSVVVRDVVRFPDQRGAILGTTFALRVIGAVALVAFSCGAELVIDRHREVRTAIVVIIALSQAFRPFDSIDLWFQAVLKWQNAFLAREIAFILASVARVVFVLSGAGLAAFAWAYVIDTGMTAIMLLIVGRVSKEQPGRWRVDWKTVVRLLKDSWPLALSSVAIVIYSQIDQVMIGWMLGNAAVGVYSVAVRISQVWYFMPGAIAQSILPPMAESSRRDPAKYRQQMKLLATFLVWAGIVVGFLFQIFGRWIIATLFGEAYLGTVPILRVYAWAGVFVALGVGTSNWYVLENKQGFMFISTVTDAGINVVLNLLLIPMLGPVGAAIATLVSHGIPTFVLTVVVPGLRPLAKIVYSAFAPVFLLRRLTERASQRNNP